MVHEVKRVEVGDDVYFWENPLATDGCLISAHGGFLPFLGNFRPADIDPSIRLHFYAREGTFLKDPGLRLMDGNYEPLNIPTAGDSVPNYLLSKFQVDDSVKDGETYQKIENKISDQFEFERAFDEASESERTRYVQLRHDQMRVHVVTIRKRLTNRIQGTTLKSVVERVFQQQQGVTQFYCSFCRNNMLNPFASTSEAVRRAPAP